MYEFHDRWVQTSGFSFTDDRVENTRNEDQVSAQERVDVFDSKLAITCSPEIDQHEMNKANKLIRCLYLYVN
jgi:hypothetical protein